MQLTRKKRVAGDIEFGIIYGCIVLLMLVAARTLPLLTVLPICFFHSVTALPCPTCGSTRAVRELAFGNLGSAFLMNPLIAVLIVVALSVLAANVAMLVFRIQRPVLLFTSREYLVIRISIVLFVLINWAYLIIART